VIIIGEFGVGNKEQMLVNIPSKLDLKSWNQLPADFLVYFPCKITTFRMRVKNVVTDRGVEVGIQCK